MCLLGAGRINGCRPAGHILVHVSLSFIGCIKCFFISIKFKESVSLLIISYVVIFTVIFQSNEPLAYYHAIMYCLFFVM